MLPSAKTPPLLFLVTIGKTQETLLINKFGSFFSLKLRQAKWVLHKPNTTNPLHHTAVLGQSDKELLAR